MLARLALDPHLPPLEKSLFHVFVLPVVSKEQRGCRAKAAWKDTTKIKDYIYTPWSSLLGRHVQSSNCTPNSDNPIELPSDSVDNIYMQDASRPNLPVRIYLAFD
jgi:hypothetical protein